jgi:plasmid segregation protein ParM
MPATPVVRSVDIGYGNTKFVVDDRRTCRIIPSLAPRADAHRTRTTFMRDRRTSVVYVEGKAYEVGEDAGLFLSSVPVLHRDYIETPEYRALLYGALDAMQTPHIDLLVTGLPVHLHESRWQRLKSLLVGQHQIRPGVTVDIRDAAVVIQPLGGFVSHCHERGDWRGHSDEIFLIVDFGFYTVDWMQTKGLQELPGFSNSVECGVSEYIQCIEQHLSIKIGDVHTNLKRLDEGLRQGRFRIKGRSVPLEPLHREAQVVVDRAIGALRNRVGTANDVDQIVVVGGGAAYFIAGLRQAFPDHPIHTTSDGVCANVTGFQIIGELIRRRAAA